MRNHLIRQHKTVVQARAIRDRNLPQVNTAMFTDNMPIVRGLEIFEGYLCEINGCEYICLKRTSMDKHCREKHGRSSFAISRAIRYQ